MEKPNDKKRTIQLFNTKYLMIASSIFLGVAGAVASFLPQEVLQYIDGSGDKAVVMILRITGALYLGFALLNWKARGNIIGGIYSRPVALGNFFHFVLVAIAFLKQMIVSTAGTGTIAGTLTYSIFAVSFGYILFSGGKACG